MYVCKSLFKHGKSSVKLKLKTKTKKRRPRINAAPNQKNASTPEITPRWKR